MTRIDAQFPQSFNRYAYVNGMPLAATDPLGLMWKCIPSAKLDSPGNTNRIATSSSDFGPYDSGADASDLTASDPIGYDDCVGLGGSPDIPEWGDNTLDGVDLGGTGLEGDFAVYGSYNSISCSGFNCSIDSFLNDGAIYASDIPMPTLQDPAACQSEILNAVNSQFGSSFTAADVASGQFESGGEYNLTISAANLSADLFNAIQTGRYGGGALGTDPSLHITGPTSVDPNATFTKTGSGSQNSIVFTAHIDTGNADTLFGLFSHYYNDVMHPESRNACPL